MYLHCFIKNCILMPIFLYIKMSQQNCLHPYINNLTIFSRKLFFLILFLNLMFFDYIYSCFQWFHTIISCYNKQMLMSYNTVNVCECLHFFLIFCNFIYTDYTHTHNMYENCAMLVENIWANKKTSFQ